MRRFALGLCLALLLGLPARAQLVLLDTVEGSARFHAAQPGPTALSMLANLETEMFVTFCGPAALATALNSLGLREPSAPAFFPFLRMTQETLFTPANLALRSYHAVQADGMTLDMLARFAGNLGARGEALHAADVPLEVFRQRLRDALGDPARRVVLNYSRVPLGQAGDGHFSPAAAYDAASDSVLILDVARYKYPPAWVPVPLLHASMLRLDSDSNLSRGLLLLSR